MTLTDGQSKARCSLILQCTQAFAFKLGASSHSNFLGVILQSLLELKEPPDWNDGTTSVDTDRRQSGPVQGSKGLPSGPLKSCDLPSLLYSQFGYWPKHNPSQGEYGHGYICECHYANSWPCAA